MKSIKKTTKTKNVKSQKINVKKLKSVRDSSLKTVKEQKTMMDGSYLNIGIIAAFTEKGTCYVNNGCTGNVVAGGKVTAMGCRAIGGKSWKGDYPGASCISGIN